VRVTSAGRRNVTGEEKKKRKRRRRGTNNKNTRRKGREKRKQKRKKREKRGLFDRRSAILLRGKGAGFADDRGGEKKEKGK